MSARTLAMLAYHKIGAPAPGGWETWNYIPEETFAAHAFLPFFLLGERVRRRRRLVSGKVSSPGAGAAVMSVASVMIA